MVFIHSAMCRNKNYLIGFFKKRALPFCKNVFTFPAAQTAPSISPICLLLSALRTVIITVMFFKNLSKLFLPKCRKCSFHNYSRVSEISPENALGKHVKVQGWIRALRKMKDYVFIDLSDGSTAEMLQVLVKKSNCTNALSYGSSIRVEGEILMGPNDRLELKASELEVVGSCDVTDGYPFVPRKQYDMDYIREHLHFRPRTRWFSSLLRLRDTASQAVGEHLRNRSFVNIHTPILTSNDCEGAGEVFSVKPDSPALVQSMEKEGQSQDEAYFNAKAFLTVSGQLQLEAAARAMTRVYTFGPTFRAENSKSRLHLSEFYMVETEIAFVKSIREIAREAELLVKAVTSAMLEKNEADFRIIGAKEPTWLRSDFTFMTYDEAIDVLEKHSESLTTPVNHGDGINKEQELFLVQHNNNVPVFVLEWPRKNKPFYMRETEKDSSKVDAMDLLAPNVGEIVGGSMRVVEYKRLSSSLPSEKLQWYADIRKFGNVPTGGFGMGFERLLQCVLGIANIKDTIPFPRWPHHCDL